MSGAVEQHFSAAGRRSLPGGAPGTTARDAFQGGSTSRARELGQLLELLHNAHSDVGTFEAEYRDWVRPRPSLELAVNGSELDGPRVQWRGAGPFPNKVVVTRRIWSKRPDCLCVEITHHRAVTRLAVLNGTQWWLWNVAAGAVTADVFVDGQRSWIVPPILCPSLLEPVRLLVALRLEVAGRGIRAGRQVVCGQGSRRDVLSPGPELTYELEFDVEHGTMLRWAMLEAGVAVRVTEAVDVTYDGEIDPERFVFAAPNRSPVRALLRGRGPDMA